MAQQPQESNRGHSPSGTTRFWLLVRAGPMAVDELDGSPTVDERRLYDMRKFNPLSKTDAIWYLGEYHDSERVLRRWFAANDDQIDTNSKALTYALSEPFDAVWNDIRDEPQYDFLTSDHGYSENQGEQGQYSCPKCGRDDIGNLPRHLRNCDGG